MAAQTIRRKVDPETYQDYASGDRSFVVCAPQDDVQPDDYFVFVEEQHGQTNREIYRKVTLVVAVEDTDVVIAGLVPVEYQALESIFAQNNTVVAYGMERRGDETRLLQEPAFLPILAAPPVNPHQANDFLGVDTWPDGQYSIQLKCHMTPVEHGQQDVTITESLIMCRTQRQLDDELLDLFLAVDHRFLLAGKLKDSFGNPVQAYFGDPGEDDDFTFTGLDADEKEESNDDPHDDEDYSADLDRTETPPDDD